MCRVCFSDSPILTTIVVNHLKISREDYVAVPASDFMQISCKCSLLEGLAELRTFLKEW